MARLDLERQLLALVQRWAEGRVTGVYTHVLKEAVAPYLVIQTTQVEEILGEAHKSVRFNLQLVVEEEGTCVRGALEEELTELLEKNGAVVDKSERRLEKDHLTHVLTLYCRKLITLEGEL